MILDVTLNHFSQGEFWIIKLRVSLPAALPVPQKPTVDTCDQSGGFSGEDCRAGSVTYFAL